MKRPTSMWPLLFGASFGLACFLFGCAVERESNGAVMAKARTSEYVGIASVRGADANSIYIYAIKSNGDVEQIINEFGNLTGLRQLYRQAEATTH